MAMAPSHIPEKVVDADLECGGANPANPPAAPLPTSGAASAGQPSQVLQLSCHDVNLPPEIRLNFIKKVYAILGFMLLINFGLAAPFIFLRETTLAFFHRNMWLLYIISVLIIGTLVFQVAMSCHMRCGTTSLRQKYLWMMKTSPWNYLYLTIFSVCFGVVAGFICAQYTVQSVLLIFALTFVLIVALTIYAVWTKADFTGCGAFILVLFLGLIMLILLYAFFPGVVLSKITAGFGAMLFGFLIVHNTQRIFGSASFGHRKLEYTLDMYALAAWHLYLDFLNFFLYLLRLSGKRR